MRPSASIWTLPLVLTLFAGCLVGGDDSYQAYATTGRFAVGYAYDGKGVEPFSGAAYLEVDEGSNTGVFVAKAKAGGTDYRIVFEDFSEAPGKAFQDGGLAADFREHGASGVGDRSIPEVDLEMSGWGLATIHVGNGKSLYKDPISGKDQWAAHFMVIRNGVRNDTNHQIHTKDHKVYGPEQAANGTSTPGDYELHLVLRNQTANATGAAQIGPFPSGAVTPSAMYSASHKFASSAPGATVTLDLSVGGQGVSASNLSFRVIDPSGDEVARRALGPGNPPLSSTATYAAQLRFPTNEAGEYTVQVSGRLAPGGTYGVRGVLTPPPSVVLNFWWEDLVFGSEAKAQGEASGMLEGTRFHGDHEHTGTSASMALRRIR